MKPKKEKKEITFPYEEQVGSVIVKIYKVANKTDKDGNKRDSFMVSYFAKGQRKQKMFADFEGPKGAKAFAHATAAGLGRGELDVLELRSTDRIAYVHAVNELRPLGIALELAAKEYAEAYRILGGKGSLIEAAREYVKRNVHNRPKKLVSEAAEEMISIKEREGASDIYMKALRRHLREFAAAYNCLLDSLTTSHVADFLRDLQVGSEKKKTLRPATARTKNNYRATLGAFFKFCKQRGWLTRDHEGIELVGKFRDKGGDIEILNVWELTQYFTHARNDMIPFLAIGAFAGLRTAEIQRLDWSEVHYEDRFIEVKAAKAKTASRRIVPISANLAAWLKDFVKPTGRVMKFENMAKQIAWLVEDVNHAFAEMAKKEGKDAKEATKLKWKHNGLRHSCISYRVAEIQNANQVALEAGNSPAMIFKHYRELVRPADAMKWFAVTPQSVGWKMRDEKPADNIIRLDKAA
jgi:integrase